MNSSHSVSSTPRSGRPLLIAIGSLLCSLFLSAPSMAEIYKWKDAEGRLHFSQDLNRVPPQHRKQADAGAKTVGKSRQLQIFERPASVPAARSPQTSTSGPVGSRVYRVKVTPSGSSMRVNVRLNDHLVVPFLIDTGASDVVLPIGVAKQLGLDLDGARTQRYRTANGVIESEVVLLESVDLGGARVENVPASVSASMRIGLLGLSYFNHFRYRVDPAAGVVMLEDNGMAESGKIRGGRSEPQWRNAYRGLIARRDGLEERLDDSGSKGSRYRQGIRDAIDEVDRQIDMLDDEADDARVPMRWRD